MTDTSAGDPGPRPRRSQPISIVLAIACSLAWIAAGGDYVAIALHAIGLPAGPLRLLASPMITVWLATTAAGPVGFALAVVIAFRLSHRKTVRGGVVIVALTGLVATFAGPTMAATTRFDLLRPDLDRVAALPLVTENPLPNYYESLPPWLAYVAVSGLVSTDGNGTVFVPQWAGIPDDAGGYIYSPGKSPEGMDMWGMGCKEPVRLDGDWWACGLVLDR